MIACVMSRVESSEWLMVQEPSYRRWHRHQEQLTPEPEERPRSFPSQEHLKKSCDAAALDTTKEQELPRKLPKD